jgi:hypothetical protein
MADAAPLVSIMINNRNYGRYLRKAVLSALGQTHPSVEVIVVDDGSTDGSLSRLARIRDPRLTVVAQPPLGQGAAYNAGWAQARGEYAIFLDSDDVLDADVVVRCLAAFDARAVKVQFAMRIVDARGRPTGGLHPPELESDDCAARVRRYGLHASPPGTGNCYRRAFLDSVMPMPDVELFVTGADAWCILQAPFHGAIRSLETPGGSYRVDRPAGVDALRVIGNANARPQRNVRRAVTVTRRVFADLRARGLVDVDGPSLPSPPLLRAWLLARVDGEPLSDDEMWGVRPTVGTIVRSVAGWRAYTIRKRVVYTTYLLVLKLLPPWLARGTVRAASRLLAA